MANAAQLEIERTELYDMVWSRPMTAVAKELGVSGVAVAKWCERLEVPRPGRGYWRRVATGARIRRPSLPPPAWDTPSSVTLARPRKVKTPEPAEESDLLRDALARLPPSIPVPVHLSMPHPLVVKTRVALRAGRTDHSGRLRNRIDEHLAVSVTPSLLSRALRIIDALIKALATQGWRVSVSRSPWGMNTCSTEVAIFGESIRFTVTERRLHARTPWLELEIHSYAGDLQRVWRDDRRGRLEDYLADFVRGLVRVADLERRRTLEREEAERLRQEAQRVREEKQRRLRRERARFKSLESAAVNWRRAARLRAFLDALEAAHAQAGPLTPELVDWLTWARAQAARIDPLVGLDLRAPGPPARRAVKAEAGVARSPGD